MTQSSASTTLQNVSKNKKAKIFLMKKKKPKWSRTDASSPQAIKTEAKMS